MTDVVSPFKSFCLSLLLLLILSCDHNSIYLFISWIVIQFNENALVHVTCRQDAMYNLNLKKKKKKEWKSVRHINIVWLAKLFCFKCLNKHDQVLVCQSNECRVTLFCPWPSVPIQWMPGQFNFTLTYDLKHDLN